MKENAVIFPFDIEDTILSKDLDEDIVEEYMNLLIEALEAVAFRYSASKMIIPFITTENSLVPKCIDMFKRHIKSSNVSFIVGTSMFNPETNEELVSKLPNLIRYVDDVSKIYDITFMGYADDKACLNDYYYLKRELEEKNLSFPFMLFAPGQNRNNKYPDKIIYAKNKGLLGTYRAILAMLDKNRNIEIDHYESKQITTSVSSDLNKTIIPISIEEELLRKKDLKSILPLENNPQNTSYDKYSIDTIRFILSYINIIDILMLYVPLENISKGTYNSETFIRAKFSIQDAYILENSDIIVATKTKIVMEEDPYSIINLLFDYISIPMDEAIDTLIAFYQIPINKRDGYNPDLELLSLLVANQNLQDKLCPQTITHGSLALKPE